MKQILADNIRFLREDRSWTQEQLADAAKVHVRTIQRAESGKGANTETLLAIAGALNVDVDLLNFDGMGFLASQFGVSREELTPEFIAQKNKELLHPYYTMVRLTPVMASADLGVLSDAMALFFKCTSPNDDVQDVAANLQQDLTDLLDASSEIDAPHRRECERNTFEHVKRLGKLGAVVTFGLHSYRFKPVGGEPVSWPTLYVIVAPEFEAKKFLLVPKNRAVASSQEA